MLIWNAVLPDLLNTNTITYWQSIGLLVLSKILFGRFNRPNKAEFTNQKFRGMTEEEKMIEYAKKFIGVPYIYGATGDGGFVFAYAVSSWHDRRSGGRRHASVADHGGGRAGRATHS